MKKATIRMRKSMYPAIQLVLSVIISISFTNCQMDGDEEAIIPDESTSIIESTSIENRPNPIACEECDFIVDSYVTDGQLLGVQPGDLICLSANTSYSRLVFRNINGTRNNPVMIKNCGGVASVYSDAAFGLKFENSKDFKLIGNGSVDEYGIKVTTEKGFYITMEKFTTDFEIAHIEVAGAHINGIGETAGFAGIGVKTSPYQDCDLFTDPTRQAWIMRDVSIHDNYIHDTGGEGIYMGHGFYKGRTESNCNAMTYSHSIKGVKIYNNLIENVGYDGMQIKNANQNVAVYDNVIRNYGTKNHSAHNEGLFIGEGTTGKFYGNIIDTGTGNGCQIQGLGNLDIFNNLIVNSGGHGIYATHGTYVIRLKDGYFNIFNNTVLNSGEYGFIFYNDDGGAKRFVNNIVAGAGVLTKNGARLEQESNNLFLDNISDVGFQEHLVDCGTLDFNPYKLSITSSCVDAGVDLTEFGIIDDLEKAARPSGIGFDIGAFELQL